MDKKPNRLYKSRLFVMIFEERKNLLELYNAVSGKNYKDPELLEINTLENAIYMSMKNDLSFLLDARLSLYEHQSTYSPNLPLRFLLYLADLLSGMTRDDNLYGSKKVTIPPPGFIVFYNGEEEQPDRRILRLSDLYGAVEQAITECINKGILKEFLERNRAEAKNVSIYEYDQDKHIRQEREAAWEKGKKEGLAEGERAGEIKKMKDLIQKKLAKQKSPAAIAAELEENESVILQLIDELEHSDLAK